MCCTVVMALAAMMGAPRSTCWHGHDRGTNWHLVSVAVGAVHHQTCIVESSVPVSFLVQLSVFPGVDKHLLVSLFAMFAMY